MSATSSGVLRTQIYASERKDSSVTRAGGVRKVHSYQSSKIRRVPGVANSLHTDYQADGDIETGQTSLPGQDGQWYTVIHGESARSLVEKGDVDWETLEKLNPRVDLKTTFPGDRIAVRQSLAPRERISATFVRQESKPIVPMSRTSLLQSPVSAASLILLSGLVGAAVAGRKQLPAVYLSLMGAGKAVLEEKEREIDELKEFQLVLERELKDLRAGSMKSELALTNLKQLLENASRTDADLRDQINTLKQSLNLKVEETKRLEASNGELESRTEAYKNRLHGAEDDLEKMKHIEQKTASELAKMTASAREYEAKVLEYREKLADVEAELSALRELSEGYSNDAVEARKMHNQALEELAVQKEANDDLEKDLSEANDRVQLHIDQIEMYRAGTERLERELAASQGEVSCLSSNLEDSTNKISQLETELESSRADICKYVTDLQEIRDDLESKRSELRSSEDALQNALREVTNLSHFPDELKSVKSELQDALNELTDRGHEISGLRGKVEELESALQSASGESSTMAIDIATLKGSLNQLESMLHESQTSNADYIGKLKEAESELESARDESTRLVEELERFKSQVGELESALSSAGDESSTLAVDLAGFKSKLHMAESALDDSRAEASDYKSELESARDESTRLVEELERFKSQVGELESALSSAGDESSTLAVDLAGFKSKLHMAESALDDSRAEASDYKSELESARDESTRLVEELERFKSQVGELESALSSAGDESSTLAVDLAGFKSKLHMAESALDDSRAEASDYKSELESARDESTRLVEELERFKSQVGELESALSSAGDESSTLAVDLAGFKSKLHMAESALDDSRAEASDYKSELESARDESTRLVEELERFKSQTEINSVSDIEDYRKEIEITHSELIAAQALVAGYLEEKDLMQQKVVSLESELVSLRKITESRVASVDVDVYITKIAALEEQLAATSDSSALVDALKRQAEEAQTQASRYKERLIKLEVNMQEKIASLNASLSDVPDSSDEVLSLQQQIRELEDEKNRMATLISNLQTQIEAIRDQKRIDVLHSQMGESNARVQDMDVVLLEARQAAQLSLAQVTQTIARMKRQATGERSSTAIKCDFNVRKEVGEHQFVVLVGSWHEWDVQRGEYMSRDGDGAWCVSTSLFADEPYEYKYCVCELNDKGLRVPVEWQIGHNHGFGFDSSLITTQRVQPTVQIRDKFVADPAHTPIILFGPNGEKFETGSTALLANMSSHLAEAGMENIQSTLERLISFLS